MNKLAFIPKVVKSSQKTKNKNLYQKPIDQEPMTLELPQGRNANAAAVNDVVAEVDNGEASIDEAPNTHLIILNFLFTACIAPWIIAK